jgi:signal transduction histidine kinase
MEPSIIQPRRLSLWRLLRGPILALLLGMGLFYLLMNPPMKEFGVMMQLMSLTALISVLLAYGAYRLGWFQRSPRLHWSLMASTLLSGVLVFLNVWIIARLMFASAHDLQLATVLLVFASGIAMSLSFFFSTALSDRILAVDEAARQIAQRRLATRIQDPGRDELASLALSFNEMAVQLQAVERKQQELDTLRRDLIAWVSHDLRTPLTSIRAILEALADGVVEDPATVQRYLRTAQGDIRALSALIDDLFEVAQVDAGGLKLEPARASLSDLVSDTLESFAALAKEQGVALSGAVQAGTDPVWLDAQRMGRVLANLVSNALRHTPAGGSVHIQARPEGSDVRVEVRDSGEGIRTEDLPHVFERFYRGEKSRSRATGGAGLGLAIAKGVIEAHGGKISVESKAGEGACFVFVVPRGDVNSE